MLQLRLFLFGPPRLEESGLPIEIGRRKALALLAYLAVTGQVHSRDTLATLLWPESSQQNARAALRRDLAALNKALKGDWFEIDRNTIGLKQITGWWLDIDHFRCLIARGQADSLSQAERLAGLREAVSLYQADFLAGFTLRDTPEFDEWQFFQTETLRQELVTALEQLVAGYTDQGDYATAIAYARRWLTVDPFYEPAHRTLMHLYARADQRSAALRQYQTCVELLDVELGLPPQEETMTLHEQICQGLVGPSDESAGRQARRRPDETAQPDHSPPSQPLLMADDIRLVTVLVADVNQTDGDFCRIVSKKSVPPTEHPFADLRAILERYEAYILAHADDQLLAIFGVRQAHEDDARRAIQAAMEMRAEAQGLGLRLKIGINTGALYLAATAEPVDPGQVYSEATVRLAVRLKRQAGGDEILVGQSTYRQARQAFIFSSRLLEPQPHSSLPPVYSVDRPRRHPRKARGIEGLRSNLIGRDEELARLKTTLHLACQGQGQIVSVIGEAGVGKSRLVAELKQAHQAGGEPWERKSGVLWLEGRCLEMNRTASYWPFIDLLRTFFAWGPLNTEMERAGRVVAMLQGLAAAGYLSQELLDEIGPLLGNLLSLRFDNDWDKRLDHADPEQVQYQTFQALRHLFIALAQRQPLILICEDLHWSDNLSLDLISYLMDVLESTPLLLLCVYRPEREHPCWRLATIASRKCPEQFTELGLRELTPSQSRQMVESLLHIEDLPPRVKTLILARSQGNPFFVEEVIQSLIDADLIYRHDDRWRARAEIETLSVPETVQTVIQGRVDRLDAASKQLLQSAAAIGRIFSRRVLNEIAPTGIDLEEVLWTLEDHALIYQEQVVPEVEYSFKHVLTQAAVYETLPRPRRAALHRQIAAAMEGLYQRNLSAYYEQLAYHYDQGEDPDRAIPYLIKAGDKVRWQTYLHQEGQRYFERALALLDALPINMIRQHWRLEAYQNLVAVYEWMGQLTEAEGYGRLAIELGHELNLPAAELVSIYEKFCWTLYWLDRPDDLIETAQAGLALLGEDRRSMEAASMYRFIAKAYYSQFKMEEGRAYTRRIIPFIETLPYSGNLRTLYTHIGEYYFNQKMLAEGLRWLERLEYLAKEAHDLRGLALVYGDKAWLRHNEGDLAGAIAGYREALALHVKTGDKTMESGCLQSLAFCHLELGDLVAARSLAEESLQVARVLGKAGLIGGSYQTLGWVCFCQNDWPQAETMLRQAVDYFGKMRDGPVLAFAPLLLANSYLAQGKRQAAQERYRQYLDASGRMLSQASGFEVQAAGMVATVLSWLEAAYDDPSAFQAFCHTLRQRYPLMQELALNHWFLKPLASEAEVNLSGNRNLYFHDPFVTGLASGWQWRDPYGDCAFVVDHGLEMRAANGRGLGYFNRSAPRLLRAAAGDFVLETVCLPMMDTHRPAIGGLIIWHDRRNYLCLACGELGADSLSFFGCLADQDLFIGRGLLRADRAPASKTADTQPAWPASQLGSAPVWLRLRRAGQQVSAFCSLDSVTWFLVGRATFSLPDPLEVGLCALGMASRSTYPGAFPEGTAIRFGDFRINVPDEHNG